MKFLFRCTWIVWDLTPLRRESSGGQCILARQWQQVSSRGANFHLIEISVPLYYMGTFPYSHLEFVPGSFKCHPLSKDVSWKSLSKKNWGSPWDPPASTPSTLSVIDRYCKQVTSHLFFIFTYCKSAILSPPGGGLIYLKPIWEGGGAGAPWVGLIETGACFFRNSLAVYQMIQGKSVFFVFNIQGIQVEKH